MGTTHNEKPLRMTPLCQPGLSCLISDSSHQTQFLLWRRALAILSYLLFSGPHTPLSQPSKTKGSGFANLDSPEKMVIVAQMHRVYEIRSTYIFLSLQNKAMNKSQQLTFLDCLLSVDVICIYTCVHTHIHKYICGCQKCVNIHTYAHIYTYRYLCTYIYSL